MIPLERGIPIATTLYCSLSDCADRLSSAGVALRLDDGPPSFDGSVLQDASRTIDEFLLLWYTEANLAVSPWVRQRCTDIAVVHLAERRGNPAPSGLARRYERTLERLEMCRLGRLNLPDVPMRKAAAPTLSNVRTVLAPVPRTVVQRARSTGTVSDYTQMLDHLDIYEFVI
jgi:Protein of unknown function (DUF1320)